MKRILLIAFWLLCAGVLLAQAPPPAAQNHDPAPKTSQETAGGSPLPADAPRTPPASLNLVVADLFYRAGKFEDAETAYKGLLKTDPKLVAAQVGLVHAMLRQQKIDESLDTANAALAAQPDSAALLAAKGDVLFRRGEMSESELSYLAAKKLDRKEGRAYLGLAQLYTAYSMYRRAYDQLKSAREIAPDDIEVQRELLGMIPRKDRLAALEAYLAGPHPDDPEETTWMEDYL